MANKRILFILPSLVMGGLEKMQVTLANALHQAGYDVTVMILDDNDELGSELDEGVRLIRKPYRSHLGKKIPYIRHKFYDDGMWETRATPRELYRYYVGSEKYDAEVAFFHGLPAKIVAGSANQDAVHLAWVHTDYANTGGYRLQFSSRRKLENAYKSFDRVVCVSESARRGFIKAVGDFGNSVTIYNLIPAKTIRDLAGQEISYRYPGSGLNLILVGRLMDKPKGQLRLIRAVSRLRSEGEKISLTLVGDGYDRERICDTIKAFDAGDYIFMPGSQKNPYPYIAGADLLVCASYYEGFNLTVAEALILGVPVISTVCAGPDEILAGGKYGMLVENSEDGLYEGLKAFCHDPGLLAQYRKKAIERRDFFDEKKILGQITALIERKNDL